MFDFTGKVVLVTGAAQGVGQVIAREFGKKNAKVCVADLTVDILDAATYGKETMLIQVDVSDRLSVEDMINQAINKYGRIDILVNNASIYPVNDFLELSDGEWDKMQAIDLKSVFMCTQTVAKEMISKQICGSIINIGTIDALHPSLGHSHYSAAKAGAYSYTMASAFELGKYGIRVNMISPGLINRPNLKDQWPDGYNRFMSRAAVQRIPEAIDIANACLFLASDLSLSITGVNLPVDSGVLTAPPY